MKEFNSNEWKYLMESCNHIVCLMESCNHIVMVKFEQSKLYESQLHGLFLVAKYKNFTSSDSTSKNTEASAAAASVDPSDSFKLNSILKSYLNTTSNGEGILFEKCRGITYVSIADEKASISVEDFDKLKALVGQLIKLHNDVKNIVNTRVPLGETEDKKIVFQKRRILKFWKSGSFTLGS